MAQSGKQLEKSVLQGLGKVPGMFQLDEFILVPLQYHNRNRYLAEYP